MERTKGEIWTDSIDGKKVVTMADSCQNGCKYCAFATSSGGACPGVVYDRHPCCASDREDGREVYFRLVAIVPEKKAPPLVFTPFGGMSRRTLLDPQ